MLLYVEQMQAQQRAEAGIKEVVIGYVGDEVPEEELIDELPDELMTMVASGEAMEVAMRDLPQDVKDILLAEHHRLRTGEVMTVEQFKQKGGEK